MIQNTPITVIGVDGDDYISLTDMAKSQLQEHIIFRWLSLKGTIEYLGEWEMLYNPDFNCTEFGTIKNAAGSNNFVLSTKVWIERTNAKGIIAKAGRYGGTYAHRDISATTHRSTNSYVSPIWKVSMPYSLSKDSHSQSDLSNSTK